jgi:hypothetical protein
MKTLIFISSLYIRSNMDSLVKDKLKMKPIVAPHKPIEVIIRADMPVLKGVTIRDMRESNQTYDINELKERLKESKLTRVTMKMPSVAPIETPLSLVPQPPPPPKKRAVKVSKKKLVIIEEDEAEPAAAAAATMEPVVAPSTATAVVEKESARRTPRVQKGVAELGPEEWVEISGEKITKRLPVKEPPVKIKLSSYYMNNRKIFVNFINSFFERYREELENVEKTITCESLKGADSFSLLTHQKIVKDYMNLYTPYRGLLLYHKLGTGKTCTSIAIAEGMKSHQRVIVMTPKSLRDNYMEELKKCGDFMYKKNQYWEWVSDPDTFETLSSVLGLSVEYIKRNKGAWLVDISKEPNMLSSNDMKSLDEQLNEMIQNKYTFINYNGLRPARLQELTDDYEKNLFDDCVIIIDEAHNFISLIVNKLQKEKAIAENARGEKEKMPKAMSLKLYEYLMSAKNARIVMLSGTPIINYPNEIGILFNILRGYIKTWEIPLDVKTTKKITKETLQESLQGEKILDYLDYSPASKKLFITRNPLGFKNKMKEISGYYYGVSNQKNNDKDETIIETDFVSDVAFERKIIDMLQKLDIDVKTSGIKIHNYKALPDKLDEFMLRFIDPVTKQMKNADVFKKRIIGLTSYFRSAQEALLPRYETTPEYYHVVKIPMSNYQFQIYESARKAERKMEKSARSKQGQFDKDGIYKDPTSTYRIFSRAFCNFVMPTPPGRPMPAQDKEVAAKKGEAEAAGGETAMESLLNKAKDVELDKDVNADKEGEIEGDEAINAVADKTYTDRINAAIEDVRQHADEYLSKTGLETYSPKFLAMLDNIQDPAYPGLHLVYSQFRTLEGIGLFTMVLEQNGFVRFRLKKMSAGTWDLDIKEADLGKPTFALYTGTESDDEKKIILKIYNGFWNDIPTNIASKLRKIANNNNLGEIIKVFMITSSGSEGINLRNTRYVHVTEPYWHPVRMEQVIGRARRICSHKDLPIELQSVEVFVYLMTFSKEQIDSDDSIELKRKDLSKRAPHIPLTSDEALYEISTIKEEINSQLTIAIKEAAIDCAVYSNGSKEGLHCVSFGEPSKTAFSYNPNIEIDESDVVAAMNNDKITWTAVPVTIQGVKYAARKTKETLYNVYNLASYQKAKEVGGDPILIGTLEIKPGGKKVFNMLIT